MKDSVPGPLVSEYISKANSQPIKKPTLRKKKYRFNHQKKSWIRNSESNNPDTTEVKYIENTILPEIQNKAVNKTSDEITSNKTYSINPTSSTKFKWKHKSKIKVKW